jgi:hypothetical protein
MIDSINHGLSKINLLAAILLELDVIGSWTLPE